MSDNRPPRGDAPAGVVPGAASAEGESTQTALKKIPLVTTVSKEYDFFSEFVSEFGAHIYPEGMFVPSPKPRPKGSRLKLDFRTRDGFRILDTICEVVRADEALPGTLSGMWVSFQHLDSAARDMIQKIYAERETSLPRDKPSEVAPAGGRKDDEKR